METNEEIYPMPSFPMLNVSDLALSSRWYQEVMGFRHIFTIPGPGDSPLLVHLRWAKYADLLLTSQPGLEGPRGQGVSLHFTAYLANRNVDDIYAQAFADGAKVIAEPADMPWNTRECTIEDPDGYRLTFAVPTQVNPRFDEVIEAVRNASL